MVGNCPSGDPRQEAKAGELAGPTVAGGEPSAGLGVAGSGSDHSDSGL
jgi:hypothetical protein